MKYTVSKESWFSAAHHLRNYNGKCENMHGHNWKVKVSVSSETLSEEGFVIDFKILKKLMNNILDKLDHYDINTVKPFDTINPTAENIASFIMEEMEKEVIKTRDDLYISKVEVWESEGSCAEVIK